MIRRHLKFDSAFIVFFIVILFSFNACSDKVKNDSIVFRSVSILKERNSELTEKQLASWFLKDVFRDTLPGISLDLAYEFLEGKKPDTVVVAVLDMTIDIDHEDLLDFIWINEDEIADNNVDDDGNGFIDDIHGWNFIGGKNNEGSQFVNYEYTRILRKYDSIFSGKDKLDIEKHLWPEFEQYSRAQAAYKERMNYAEEEAANASGLSYLNSENKSILSQYILSSEFTIEKLDSLSFEHINDTVLQKEITFRKQLIQYGILDEDIFEDKLKADERIDKLLNLEYNDRKFIGDKSPDDLNYINYGNNIVNYNTSLLDHGTLVAGVIAANRDNNKGASGITNAVKIMPLSISAYGDEHDKDIALAIRYAVDNGASIINMSSGKSFSMNQQWVKEAIKYAEKKDVLIVTSAGNDGLDLDDKSNFNYPNDTEGEDKEVSNNFIKVGSSTYHIGEGLFDKYSNYGNREVDIFAPGEEIYTTAPLKDQYISKSGTSFSAPIVSGIAALVRAYYPKLTAEEVKNIILESGVEYAFEVNISKEEEQPDLVPFSSLSKSGKIVNAYYALQLAEQISQN